MKYLFLFFCLFVCVPVGTYAQRYPYDKGDVDAFVIDGSADDYFTDTNDTNDTQQQDQETQTDNQSQDTTTQESQSESDSTSTDTSNQSSSSSDSTNSSQTETTSTNASQETDAVDDTSQSTSDTTIEEDASSTDTSEESGQQESIGDDTSTGSTADTESTDEQTTGPSPGEGVSNDSTTNSTNDSTSDSSDTVAAQESVDSESSVDNTNQTEGDTSTTNDTVSDEESDKTLLDTLFNLVGLEPKGEEKTEEGEPSVVLVEIKADSVELSDEPITVEEVTTAEALALFVQDQVATDKHVLDAVVTETKITTQYKQTARLFGVIPISYIQDVALTFPNQNTLGDIIIEKPWWTVFTSGDDTRRLKIEIQKEVNQILLSGAQLTDEDVEGLLQRLASLFSVLLEVLRGFSQGLFG